MSSREETQLEFYERLIRTHHKELLRLASIWLYQRANDAVDFGRAEEAAQETFTIAWEKREILMEHPKPIAWLNIALKNVIKNMVRDDQRWAECLLRVPAEQVQPAPGADLELEGIIPSEDMDILKRLYLYGETYEEICEDLGLKNLRWRCVSNGARSCSEKIMEKSKKIFLQNVNKGRKLDMNIVEEVLNHEIPYGEIEKVSWSGTTLYCGARRPSAPGFCCLRGRRCQHDIDYRNYGGDPRQRSPAGTSC